ncbi:threonine dehydratase [Faunimonas pinastri]|uniref:L-threonine dehydratase n=1 Tax=Faunimonas pinastri TaxID=1855383 RepID=A0A1H9B4C5_9HYPH|nr:threonine dehydratase [Faunimonas pinastri]
MLDLIKNILSARVYDVAIESPLDSMPRISSRLGNKVLLKREDLQPVFSFKLRGAYNKISKLSVDELARGVICASAGNHAQGLALAAQRLGVRATIVMPRTTPDIKVNAVRSRGAAVVLHGDTFDEASLHAGELREAHGYVYVHPFDDLHVIAGQGTIGMEILRQHSGPIEAVFLPVGGGGLAAGVAAYIKFIRPEVKVIGVEPEDAASMKAALEAGRPVALNQVGLFADGVAVRLAGSETFRLCRQFLDEIVTVTTDEICAAVKDIFDDTRAVAEPSGAVGLAGMKKYVEREGLSGATLIAVNTGANVNFDRLRYVAERADVGERTEALLAVTIPEEVGSYRAFIGAIGERAITEFNYRWAETGKAHVFAGVKLRGGDRERQDLVATLRGKGYAVVDMTDNELAKLHVRYMVGGRVPELADEIIFRFEFPERPGALLKFLDSLSPRWNISLFHYRNHGSDNGRVLAGLQVPQAERAAFLERLTSLGYPFTDETDNPAYGLFLGTGDDRA